MLQTIATFGSLFAANFGFVFLKAFQQRNVAFDNYAWIVPVSLLMAATEFYTVVRVVEAGWSVGVVLAGGMGAGLGALLAALLHKRMFKRNARTD